MHWPPPVDLAENPSWWDKFWGDDTHCGFGSPSEGLLRWIPAAAPNACAVDVASGNGRYACELYSRGYRTTALELSRSGASRIEETAARLGLEVTTEVGDFLQLSQTPRAYDIVMCSGLLEEIPLDAYGAAIRGLYRWASPGGIVINRYCLEITGRGVFAENGHVPSLYQGFDWTILHQEELLTPKMSKGGFEIRHGTVVARKGDTR
jgi:cyclopropane fatty-acyl-phospholipid synthase-like methyltransferase